MPTCITLPMNEKLACWAKPQGAGVSLLPRSLGFQVLSKCLTHMELKNRKKSKKRKREASMAHRFVLVAGRDRERGAQPLVSAAGFPPRTNHWERC